MESDENEIKQLRTLIVADSNATLREVVETASKFFRIEITKGEATTLLKDTKKKISDTKKTKLLLSAQFLAKELKLVEKAEVSVPRVQEFLGKGYKTATARLSDCSREGFCVGKNGSYAAKSLSRIIDLFSKI